jgi:hypothetical protein
MQYNDPRAAPSTDDTEDDEETGMPKPTTSAETIAAAGFQPKMGIAKANDRGTPTSLRKGQDRTQALIAAMIPVDIRKQIDDEELGDRLAAAARLLERARGTTGVVAAGYGQMARDILKAQPRAVTTTQVRSLMTKSAQSTTPAEQERWRAAAERVKAEHPMAPQQRPPDMVAKAGKAGSADEELVAVYDASGDLLGVVPRSKMTPVEAITRDAVTKAHAARKRGQR